MKKIDDYEEKSIVLEKIETIQQQQYVLKKYVSSFAEQKIYEVYEKCEEYEELPENNRKISSTLPVVSYIIFAKGNKEEIVKTLKSIENQSNANWECVIINFSNENLELTEYNHLIKYIITRTEENQLHLIFNGIKLITGNIVNFVEAGNIIEKDISNKVINAYSKKKIDIIYIDSRSLLSSNIQNNSLFYDKNMELCSYFIATEFLRKQIDDISYTNWIFKCIINSKKIKGISKEEGLPIQKYTLQNKFIYAIDYEHVAKIRNAYPTLSQKEIIFVIVLITNICFGDYSYPIIKKMLKKRMLDEKFSNELYQLVLEKYTKTLKSILVELKENISDFTGNHLENRKKYYLLEKGISQLENCLQDCINLKKDNNEINCEKLDQIRNTIRKVWYFDIRKKNTYERIKFIRRYFLVKLLTENMLFINIRLYRLTKKIK